MTMKRFHIVQWLVVAGGFLHNGSLGQEAPIAGMPADTASTTIDTAVAGGRISPKTDSIQAQGTIRTDSVGIAGPVEKAAAPTADDSSIHKIPGATNDSIAPTRAAIAPDSLARKDSAAAAPIIHASAAAASSDSFAHGDKGREAALAKAVDAGRGTSKKECRMGAVAEITREDLAGDASGSLGEALQGRVAGVNIVRNNGAPGMSKGMIVHIRGVGTINGSEPLYVVDGIPVSGIDFLNPDDVERVTILKDASAAAMYGARGANGVVVVDTKSAPKGAGEVRYDMYWGVQQAAKKPSLCTTGQWAWLNNQARLNSGDSAVIGWTPSWVKDPSGLPNTDWWGEITNKNAIVQKHTVSIARGTDKLAYFLSAGYFGQDGILKGSGFRSATFLFKAENRIAPWITFGSTVAVDRTVTDFINETDEWHSLIINTLAFPPAVAARDSAGNPASGLPFTNMINPAAVVDRTFIKDIKAAIFGRLYSDINLSNTLKLRSAFGIHWGLDDSSYFSPTYSNGSGDVQSNSIVARRTGLNKTWTIENTVTYDKKFIGGHGMRLRGGIAAQDAGKDFIFAQNQKTASNDSAMRFLDATTGQTPTVGGSASGSSLASAFGGLEYNFDDTYVLDAVVRRDGSSRFGPESRWGNFPAVAGAWRLSREGFMRGAAFIDELKVRGGWGKTGNLGIPDAASFGIASAGNNYPFGDAVSQGTAFPSLGTKDIRWEAQRSANAGFDIVCCSGRFELSGDYFRKVTEGMVLKTAVPGIVGYQTMPYVNAGSVENKGLELTFEYRESIGAFRSRVGMNLSTYKNKVLSLGAVPSMADGNFRSLGPVTKTEPGHPIGEFWGYKTNGLFQSRAEVDSFVFTGKDGGVYKVQPNAGPGDVRYVDDDHDGVWDKGYIGSPHPDFIAGLSFDVAFKGFDLSGLISIVYGNEIFNGTRWYTDNSTGFYNCDTRRLQAWTSANPTNDVNYPRMNYNGYDNSILSDRFIEDGSYARISALQLGYTFQEPIGRRLGMKTCRVYIGAENLLTLTRYWGLDPEVGIWGDLPGGTNSSLTAGIDRGAYPQARSFIAGLNVAF
jgi:TonB-linked SusC/RagA family outer membrane protein